MKAESWVVQTFQSSGSLREPSSVLRNLPNTEGVGGLQVLNLNNQVVNRDFCLFNGRKVGADEVIPTDPRFLDVSSTSGVLISGRR